MKKFFLSLILILSVVLPLNIVAAEDPFGAEPGGDVFNREQSQVNGVYVPPSTNNSSTGNSCGTSLVNLRALLCEVEWLLNQAMYFIFVLAFIVFFYGVFQTIRKGGEPEERKKGRDFMMYGIISLAVMFSVWGLVNFVLRTFNLQDSGPVPKNIKTLIQ